MQILNNLQIICISYELYMIHEDFAQIFDKIKIKKSLKILHILKIIIKNS